MHKISRAKFIEQSLKTGVLVTVGSLGNWLPAEAATAQEGIRVEVKDNLLQRLMAANDREVDKLLQMDAGQLKFSRKIGHDFAAAAAAYCLPDSKHYHSVVLVSILQKLVAFLASFQADDGTVNIANVESPPDTAFLLESLTAGALLLKKDNSPELERVNANIKRFLLKAGEALITGGVHTPNHRWVVCAALARLNALYPARKYGNRIEDWLGEGIFNDSDGHYPERSMNYAIVENNSMITLARLLNKPALLEPVRKNLEMVYYYMEPNGDLVTTDSRRQDQYTTISIVEFYRHYRYLAIRYKDAKLAGITKLIEQLDGFEERIIHNDLFHFLENSLLQNELPESKPPPVHFEKLFSTSHLLRIRRNNATTTFFGGADWPIIIASGRSDSPNFYAYRKGKAALKYMRLSTGFFRMGYFYSEGLKKTDDQYILHKKVEVPYYQPLPKHLRNAKGDYKLSPSVDDRFWNKMDFKNRPVSNVKTLQTTVILTETEGKNELSFQITGQVGIEVTIELCFGEGGTLSGVSEPVAGNYFLEKNMGRYEFKGDSITFGPGVVSHKNITGLEGERYSTHFGSLRTEGMHVYLTGITPFRHKLSFR